MSIMRASLSGLTISHLCLSALPRRRKKVPTTAQTPLRRLGSCVAGCGSGLRLRSRDARDGERRRAQRRLVRKRRRRTTSDAALNPCPWCGVPQFQPPQRTPGQTRQARGGRQGPPGGAWAGPGAHCGVGPAWVLGGFFLASCPPISVRDRQLAHFCSEHTTGLLLRTACAFAAPAPTAEGPRFPAPPGPPCATGRPRPPRSRR